MTLDPISSREAKMRTSQDMGDLYRIIDELAGSTQAKEALVTMLYNVVTELQEDGLAVTNDNLEERIHNYVKDFKEVSDKTNAA